jgi:hypothetical protein
MNAARELRSETDIAGTPDQVWAVLTDLDRLPGLSTELVKMVPLKPGGLKLGQQYLGLNKRKAVVWPSRSKVVALDPDRELAWHTYSSGATWIFELSPIEGGTRVVHRRPVPTGLTALSKFFATLFLGGGEHHADELEVHVGQTLARLKAAVEA